MILIDGFETRRNRGGNLMNGLRVIGLIALWSAGCGGASGGPGGGGDLGVAVKDAGGDGGSIDCSPVKPCGGDLTGSWLQRGGCSTGGLSVLCPGATTESSHTTIVI